MAPSTFCFKEPFGRGRSLTYNSFYLWLVTTFQVNVFRDWVCSITVFRCRRVGQSSHITTSCSDANKFPCNVEEICKLIYTTLPRSKRIKSYVSIELSDGKSEFREKEKYLFHQGLNSGQDSRLGMLAYI